MQRNMPRKHFWILTSGLQHSAASATTATGSTTAAAAAAACRVTRGANSASRSGHPVGRRQAHHRPRGRQGHHGPRRPGCAGRRRLFNSALRLPCRKGEISFTKTRVEHTVNTLVLYCTVFYKFLFRVSLTFHPIRLCLTYYQTAKAPTLIAPHYKCRF